MLSDNSDCTTSPTDHDTGNFSVSREFSPDTFGVAFVPTNTHNRSEITADEICSAPIGSSPTEVQVVSPARAVFVRTLALLCACSLSVGSHYASHTLAPLKSRLSRELGTSHTEFSLLISAISLNGTWTPLVGGVLASQLGTTLAGILATGIVFLGQVVLLVGETQQNVRLMVLGLFIYGLGLSPIAVVQESIIVRFFHSHGLATSMAIGLVAGKLTSFVSARTSYPLSVTFGRHAPFYVSTALTGFSFAINLVYMFASHWLIAESGITLEASEARNEAQRRAVYSIPEATALKKVAKKRRVSLKDIPLLGDVFWAYIGLNVLCGTLWSPFTHLAANLLEKLYNLDEATAGEQASYLFAGSIIMYPVTGYLVDRIKNPRITIRIFVFSSLLTLFCFVWLAVPLQWTISPLPGVISFAAGIGFAPLLLVVIVPTLVPLKYVSTTLGVHKAMEHTGAALFQTLAGIWLDSGVQGDGPKPPRQHDTVSIRRLFYVFIFFNALQLISLEGLAYLDKCRRSGSRLPYSPADLVFTPDADSAASTGGDRETCRSHSPTERTPFLSHDNVTCEPTNNVCRRSEKRRGRIYTFLSALLICAAWVVFLNTAWLRLRSREERGVW